MRYYHATILSAREINKSLDGYFLDRLLTILEPYQHYHQLLPLVVVFLLARAKWLLNLNVKNIFDQGRPGETDFGIPD